MELKPCPFCGGIASIMNGKSDDGTITFAVICQNCHTGVFRAKSYEWDGFEIENVSEAEEMWNRRAE